MVSPIFFDPTGRRRSRVRLAVLAALLVMVLASAVFATTLLDVPAAAPLPIDYERMAPLPFRAQVSRLRRHFTGLFLPHSAPAEASGRSLTVGFYSPEMEDGAASLARHVGEVDWLAPTMLSLDSTGKLAMADDPALRRVMANSLHRPLVVPVIQNIAHGTWNGAAAAALMHDPRRRAVLVGQVANYLARTGDAGIMYDFENLPDQSLPDLVKLVAETRARSWRPVARSSA